MSFLISWQSTAALEPDLWCTYRMSPSVQHSAKMHYKICLCVQMAGYVVTIEQSLILSPEVLFLNVAEVIMKYSLGPICNRKHSRLYCQLCWGLRVFLMWLSLEGDVWQVKKQKPSLLQIVFSLWNNPPPQARHSLCSDLHWHCCILDFG